MHVIWQPLVNYKMDVSSLFLRTSKWHWKSYINPHKITLGLTAPSQPNFFSLYHFSNHNFFFPCNFLDKDIGVDKKHFSVWNTTKSLQWKYEERKNIIFPQSVLTIGSSINIRLKGRMAKFCAQNFCHVYKNW